MQVILLKDIDKIGKLGDAVSVKKGYARNFLLPRKLAIEASAGSLKFVEQAKKKHEQELIKAKTEMEELAKKIGGMSCTVTMAAGEEDKLFGSVTAEHIKEAFAAEGVEIDKRQVRLTEPIKKLGVYPVEIKLHPEVTASTKVWVVKK